MSRSRTLGQTGIGLLAAVLLCAGVAQADLWSKSYPVTARAQLRLTTDDGSIEVISSDQKEVTVRVETTGWTLGSDKDVRITESQAGDQIEVNVRVPHWHFNFFGTNRRSIRLEVHVPRRSDLDLHTGDGRITSESVSGRIRLDTDDGSIAANGLQGDIRMHTGDGRVEGNRFDGSLDVLTGDGHITVSGRFDTLRLKTGDGHIEATAQNGSKMTSDWSLRSGDGSITLRVPEGLSAELDAHTGDGRVYLDFPVTVSGALSPSRIRGTLGKGGPQLSLRTGDGSIRLGRP